MTFAVAIVTCTLGTSAPAQTPVRSIEERLSDPVYMTWVDQPEVGACLQCHLKGPGLGVFAPSRSELTTFSRRQEMEAWISLDKHTIARQRVEPFDLKQQETQLIKLFDNLERRAKDVIANNNDPNTFIDVSKISLTEIPEGWLGRSQILSRRICDKLWGEGHVGTDDGYRDFVSNCLTCHGGIQPNATNVVDLAADRSPSMTPPADGSAARSTTSEPIGIDYLYCHQNDAENPTWIQDHYPFQSNGQVDVEKWRLLSPEEKSAAGMTDLANTATQASMCLDCHVGNHSKGMFVTHAMYAAGHPPLPPVDVQTFCDAMPQHWQTPGQLYANLADDPSRDPYFKTNYPGLTDDTSGDQIFWQTRKVLLGALQARRASLRLYADAAAGDHWGDYAMYDCASCHHELRRDSLRQQQYLTSANSLTPGRPRPPQWPDVLLPIIYDLAGPKMSEKAYSLEQGWMQSFDRTPFGVRDEVKINATELNQLIDSITDTVSRRPITQDTATTVLRRLVQTPPERIVSYDAARQLAWTISAIADEVETHRGTAWPTATGQVLTQLADPEITGLDLSLPAGRLQTIYPDYLKGQLRRQAGN